MLSLCVCVCLSVTRLSSTKTAKGRITQRMPQNSPETPVFSVQRALCDVNTSIKFDRCEFFLASRQAWLTQRNVIASTATHGPDPSPDLSLLRSPCLARIHTRVQAEVLVRIQVWVQIDVKVKVKVNRLKLVLDRGRDSLHGKRRVEQSLGLWVDRRRCYV